VPHETTTRTAGVIQARRSTGPRPVTAPLTKKISLPDVEPEHAESTAKGRTSSMVAKRDFEMDSTLIGCRLTKQEPSRPDRHEGDPKQDRDRQVPPELGRLV